MNSVFGRSINRSYARNLVMLAVVCAFGRIASCEASISSQSYGNIAGSTVTFEQIVESSETDSTPLYNTPSVTGDSLKFNPNLFNSYTSTSVGPASDDTNGLLAFFVQSNDGSAMKSLKLSESGVLSLAGAAPSDSTYTQAVGGGLLSMLDNEEDRPDMGLLPVYPLTEGLTQYHMRRMVSSAIEHFGGVLDEVFSEALLTELNLMPIAEALKAVHSPENAEQLAGAQRRFIFQELFVLQLAVVARRHQQQVSFRAPHLAATADITARIQRLFPFEWTAGQRAAVQEVANDLASETPMNRLLQGDVGSGKTVVAVYAMLVCVAAGYQAALMAPTEILARQHAETLATLLRASRVRHMLLTGSLSAKEREAVLADIAAGKVDLVIGTHAVVQSAVHFAKLGLVVIDEQHKFGVRQRAALRQGEKSPHYLVMTATPIPRTISMTLFGDLDVSTIREMPPGRQEVRTYIVEPEKRARWWQFVRDKLRAGRQAFVVTPLVDESENVAAASVAEAFERLANGELADFRVGLIHGRLSPAEKEQAMADFRAGRTQALVSTSVIEVGVDIPNASIMVIDSAERFGLAQLHQLRGRVGRGIHAGFCGVLVDEELSEQARQRLDAFAATSDGFALAEMDFELRGPGDLFSTQQHGLPPLRIADLRRDKSLLEEAREHAKRLFTLDPGLTRPENARLRRQMLARYGRALELADVG